MDNKQLFKQMMILNKTAFDTSFSAMSMVYEQNQKMMEAFLSQATWMPEAGKRAVKEWLAAYHKGCSQFKALVDDGYAKVEAYFETSPEGSE